MSKRTFLTTIALILAVIGGGPLISMLCKSLVVDGSFSISAYREVLSSGNQWHSLSNSFVLAAAVTALCSCIGIPLGIIFEKTNLALRSYFVVLFAIPLMVPSYIYAVAWSDVVAGPITAICGNHTAAIFSHLLFGLPGATLVLTTVFLPIPIILTMVFLRTVNPALEEAARTAAGWKTVLKSITIPLVMPGIMLSALLVFLLTMGELSVPLFLRYQVFPAESFIQFSAFYNFNAATATALPLAGIAIVALAFEERFLHNKTCLPRIHARNCRSSMQLGRWHIPVFAIISSCAIIFIMTPVATLLVQAGSTYPAALRKAGSSLSRGVSYAFIGASIITFLGFFSGYIIQKKQPPFWHALDSLMLFLFVLPGSVIGIGLISLWNHSYTNFVYTTPLIIILGYIAKYTAISSRVCAATLTQIPPSMEDAAQVSGAGWFSSITTISIPMARHGLLAAWLATYTFLLRDTDVTMLVYPAGHETLAVRIFTMMANGNPNLIAALCIIMMTAALLPAALFFMTFKKYITRII